jgi:dCTP deaminase
MTALVDYEIERWALGGALRPFDPTLVNPASINLRVGATAKIESMSGFIDVDLGAYTRDMPYLVPPGGWILTDCLESIRLASDMEGTVVLRSSAARRGWDHAMAGFVDPGYGMGTANGSKLTLEFVNCLKFQHLPIYPGIQLVQLRINMLQRMPRKPYHLTGRYNDAQEVEGCKDPTL